MQSEYVRRAPLEEGRHGQAVNHHWFYSIAKIVPDERIDDPDPANDLPVPHFFGKQISAAGLFCRVKNQRIPEGQFVQAMRIDGHKKVGAHIMCRAGDAAG
jgi:hypothetical protein